MKIRAVGAELFCADGRDECNSRFRNFAKAPGKRERCLQRSST